MKGLHEQSWRCGEAPSLCGAGGARPIGPVPLAPFATALPPELLERLRAAAPKLGAGESAIAAAAIDLWLAEEGF